MSKKSEKKDKTIRNLREFLAWRGFAGETPAYWARCFYKYTDCGPWAVFLEGTSDAHDVEHEEKIARIRCVRGQAKLLNPEELDERTVSFLGFDSHGLSKQERKWDAYMKLIDDFLADEAKQERTKRTLDIVKRTVAELHVKQPARTEHFDAEYREVCPDDLRREKGEWEHKPCSCKRKRCRKCYNTGTIRTWKGTGETADTLDEAKCVGIKFGSIVEGSDACSGPYYHMFPFKASEFDRDVDWMEQETSFYWKRDNASWYRVRTDDDEWVVANVWGDIEWEGEPPPEPIKAAAEKAINEDWQPDPERPNSCIVQTIPEMPGYWEKPNPDWKALPLGDTGAEIYTFEDDSTFD